MSLETMLSQVLCNQRASAFTEDLVKVLNGETEKHLLHDYKPKCKYNVTYIVAVVLVDDQNRCCLIQEAKQSCRGKWYLPAGRMESNEDLCLAAKRECLEETGYEVEPLSLCSIEVDSCGVWFRFTFIGVVTGGSLKTPAQADSESMQAAWFDIDELKKQKTLSILRSRDFIPFVDIAASYYKKFNFHSMSAVNNNQTQNFIMPAVRAHEQTLFSYLILNRSSDSYLAVDGTKLPSAFMAPFNRSSHYVFHPIESIIFPSKRLAYTLHGAAAISYDGKSAGELHDGLHILYVVTLQTDVELDRAFSWCKFTSADTVELIKRNLADENSYIKINLN